MQRWHARTHAQDNKTNSLQIEPDYTVVTNAAWMWTISHPSGTLERHHPRGYQGDYSSFLESLTAAQIHRNTCRPENTAHKMMTLIPQLSSPLTSKGLPTDPAHKTFFKSLNLI